MAAPEVTKALTSVSGKIPTKEDLKAEAINIITDEVQELAKKVNDSKTDLKGLEKIQESPLITKISSKVKSLGFKDSDIPGLISTATGDLYLQSLAKGVDAKLGDRSDLLPEERKAAVKREVANLIFGPKESIIKFDKTFPKFDKIFPQSGNAAKKDAVAAAPSSFSVAKPSPAATLAGIEKVKTVSTPAVGGSKVKATLQFDGDKGKENFVLLKGAISAAISDPSQSEGKNLYEKALSIFDKMIPDDARYQGEDFRAAFRAHLKGSFNSEMVGSIKKIALQGKEKGLSGSELRDFVTRNMAGYTYGLSDSAEALFASDFKQEMDQVLSSIK